MCKSIVAATLAAGALLAVANDAQAVVTTFASFSPSGSTANVLWTNSNGAAGTGTGGTFISTATATSTVVAARLVKFSFLQPDLAPYITNANATLTLNATVPTGNRAVLAGLLIQGAIQGSFTFKTTAPIVIGTRGYAAGSNLLTCTFTGNPFISGHDLALLSRDHSVSVGSQSVNLDGKMKDGVGMKAELKSGEPAFTPPT